MYAAPAAIIVLPKVNSCTVVYIYTIKAKAVSGVTLLVLILPSNKTPNYPPMLLILRLPRLAFLKKG
jgi:hypothetical protein